MRSKKSGKKIRKRNKTLKNNINKYICKKSDICCEEDIDRKRAIEEIFKLYSDIAEMMDEKDDYLSYINNDIIGFIGYKIDLEKMNDVEGIKLWNKIDRKMLTNKKLNKTKITKLLYEVPLYYLLSFLGYAYYKHKENEKVN